jgi:hypothetical protein
LGTAPASGFAPVRQIGACWHPGLAKVRQDAAQHFLTVSSTLDLFRTPWRRIAHKVQSFQIANRDMRFSLTVKIILLLQVALCFALTSTAALSYLKMERMVEDTVASRFSVALRGLGSELEGAVSLGVTLGALRNLDALIQRAMQRDSRITGLMLFNETGEILASAGRGSVTGTLPADWAQAFARNGKAEHGAKVTSGDSQVLLSGIRNAFGGLSGGIALTYSLDEVRAGIRSTIPELVISGAINLVTCLVVTMLVVWFVLRPIQRRLLQATVCIEALGKGETPVVPEDLAAFVPGLRPFIDRVVPAERGGVASSTRPAELV